MTVSSILLLFFTAVLAGALNSVAGGGTFFTFPALIFSGIPAINANATSTVAVWPGSLASVGAYRRELAEQRGPIFIALLIISILGGALGAWLLLHTPASTFVRLIPYLLLLATLLFTFSKPLTERLRRGSKDAKIVSRSWISFSGIVCLQLIISIYGGYFGAGIGILTLASLGLMGMSNIHVMNALKTVLVSCVNGVAVIIFIVLGVVVWPQAILMLVGAIIGGYGGAYYARKIEQKWIRLFVILVGFGTTVYFFIPR